MTCSPGLLITDHSRMQPVTDESLPDVPCDRDAALYIAEAATAAVAGATSVLDVVAASHSAVSVAYDAVVWALESTARGMNLKGRSIIRRAKSHVGFCGHLLVF